MPNETHADGSHTLSIRRGGGAFRGVWRLEGDRVRVESAYGDLSAPLAGAAPRAVAETLLGALAFRWTAQTRAA